MLDTSIGFVGAGQMATALARGFVASKLIDPTRIIASDPNPDSRSRFESLVDGARTVTDNVQVIEESDITWLAVKPQVIHGVMPELSKSALKEKLFVSIVTGVTVAQLSAALGTNNVIRVMPNTPCLIGEGASGYCPGESVSDEQAGLIQQLLEAVGIAYRLNEMQLDVVTGLSGSGPAYIYTVIEALSDGGVRMGLPRDIATALAAQTVHGAAEMVKQTGEHPAQLKDRVTSPGGTTIAGLQVLEQRAVRGAFIDAVEAACNRAIELGK
jgi:pyrroline-5-carboxylate reductase